MYVGFIYVCILDILLHACIEPIFLLNFDLKNSFPKNPSTLDTYVCTVRIKISSWYRSIRYSLVRTHVHHLPFFRKVPGTLLDYVQYQKRIVRYRTRTNSWKEIMIVRYGTVPYRTGNLLLVSPLTQ